jgi:hypothetical protein
MKCEWLIMPLGVHWTDANPQPCGKNASFKANRTIDGKEICLCKRHAQTKSFKGKSKPL